MGLFTKKDPCAICGGKVTGLLPWKVEGQLVCKECYGNVHLPEDFAQNMTLEEFKAYRQFREENSLLRQQFQTTQQVDFGLFDDHILFDTTNGLFCPSINLESTIFEGKCVKSFVIREDNAPLFEGSANGLLCYTSAVPDRVAAMTPMVQQVAMIREMQRQADRIAKEEGRETSIRRNFTQDIPEPFQKFIVEIHCDHPYWKILTMDKKAPMFNDSAPDVNDYMRRYNENIELIAQLARGLMAVAFPGAPEQFVAGDVVVTGSAPAANVDAVAEIKRYKDLMDQGIITEDEFNAKKRQLLGI